MLVNDEIGKAIKEKHKLDEKDFSSQNQTSTNPIGPIDYPELENDEINTDENLENQSELKENVEINATNVEVIYA